MKRVWIFACTLTLMATAGVAQTAGTATLTSRSLAAILGERMATSSCPTPRSEVPFAARQSEGGWRKSSCTATASCGSGSVTCSGAHTCAAYDRNCDIGEQGHVTCDGVTKRCFSFCPIPFCQQCESTGDCYACCRCDGGDGTTCSAQCL